MELREYMGIVRRWIWLLALGVVLAGGTAYLVSINMTPVYRASVTLLVDEGADQSMSDYTALLTSERLAKTYSELLTSRPVLQEVSDRLDLERWLSLRALEGMVDVQLVRDTQLLRLAVEHGDPQWAAKIADEIAQVFTRQVEALQSRQYAGSLESLSGELTTVQGEIARIEASIAQLQKPEASPAEGELARLEDNLAQLRSTYSGLLQTYEDIRVAAATNTDTVVIVVPAETPKTPVSPRVLLNTALASVVGLMLAVGIVFLVEYLDDTVKTADDVEQALGLPTLGVITRVSDLQQPQDDLVTAHKPRSAGSEAYRVLRTNVQFASVGNPEGVLLVTSPGPLEGKTTIAANLAVTMAQGGHKVCLVDTDLRKPRLHRLFGLYNGAGFSDLLMNDQLSFDGVMQTYDLENLVVITSGRLPPNPAELLGSQRAKQVIASLAKTVELVILDSPPALAVADAAILAATATGVILVIEQGRTRSQDARHAKESLEKVDAKLLGVVVNKVAPKRGYGYYHYYYYYGENGRDGHRKPS